MNKYQEGTGTGIFVGEYRVYSLMQKEYSPGNCIYSGFFCSYFFSNVFLFSYFIHSGHSALNSFRFCEYSPGNYVCFSDFFACTVLLFKCFPFLLSYSFCPQCSEFIPFLRIFSWQLCLFSRFFQLVPYILSICFLFSYFIPSAYSHNTLNSYLPCENVSALVLFSRFSEMHRMCVIFAVCLVRELFAHAKKTPSKKSYDLVLLN